MKKVISIVVPLFNEELNIPLIYKAITDQMQQNAAQCDYELIFVDDGSTDGTWQQLSTLAKRDEKIRALKFSRNFGHQIALMAGYDHAKGDAIITIDGDMQHPPSLIPLMVSTWERGIAIVYARKKQRNESWAKQLTARWFYALLDSISQVPIPTQVSDFRLIDKKVKDILVRSKERDPYIRGFVAWTGFSHEIIDFVQADRLHGKTGYTWKKMFKLAFDGLIGFSMVPLKLAAYVGILVIVTGSIMFAIITIDALFFHAHYPLFKWLVTIIYIFMGIQFLLVWILGEYIGRMHEQQKGRPLYIIECSLEAKKN